MGCGSSTSTQVAQHFDNTAPGVANPRAETDVRTDNLLQRPSAETTGSVTESKTESALPPAKEVLHRDTKDKSEVLLTEESPLGREYKYFSSPVHLPPITSGVNVPPKSNLPLPDLIPKAKDTTSGESNLNMEGAPMANEQTPVVVNKGKTKNKFPDLFDKPEGDALREIRERLNQLLRLSEYTPDACMSDLEFLQACTQAVPSNLRPRKIVYCDEIAKSSYVQVFKRIYEQNFNTESFRSGSKKQPQMMKTAAVILWNGTDASRKLCDEVVNTKLHEDLLRFMNDPILLPHDDNEENMYTLYIAKGMFGILHNLLQQCDVRDALRTANALEIMKQYRASSSMMLKCKAEFNLAYIVTEEEYAQLNANAENIKFIIDILKATLKSQDHFSKKFGYRSDEVVRALNKLAANDNNKENMVKEGILKYYTELLDPDHSSEEEQKSAASGIWMLSFKGKDAILQEPNCMDSLRKLAEKSSDNDVKKAANGALWILEGKKETSVEKATQQIASQPSDQGHVMISYNWGCQPTMLKVRDRLKQEGYNVWMDVESMTGSILQTMATAVEKSSVVVVCVTEKYKESPNCRTEAEYAYNLRKRTIPLLLEKGYKADGWLGALLGTKLYFDLTKENRFESNLANFIKELKLAYGEMAIQPQTGSLTGALPARPSTPGVTTWREAQVVEWLKKQGLTNAVKKFDGMDGSLLVEFSYMRRDAADFFYCTLRDQMKLSLIEILKFTKALKAL